RTRLAFHKTNPDMPMPRRANIATAATSRLRIVHTVPDWAGVSLTDMSCVSFNNPKLSDSNLVQTASALQKLSSPSSGGRPTWATEAAPVPASSGRSHRIEELADLGLQTVTIARQHL